MSSAHETPGARFGRRLIHQQKTFSPLGTMQAPPSVYCPLREQSLPLEECVLCEECAGVVRGRNDEVSVTCRCWRAATYVDANLHQEGEVQAEAWLLDHTPVAEVMEQDSIFVSADLSNETLVELLTETDRTAAAVVDSDCRPVGIITRSDLLRQMHDETPAPPEIDCSPALGAGFHVIDLPHATVADLMTPTTLCICETAPVSRAAAVLAFERVHQLVVTSVSGCAVGLISAIDIARWLARLSGYPIAVRALEPPQVVAHDAAPGSDHTSAPRRAETRKAAPYHPRPSEVVLLVVDRQERFLDRTERMGRDELMRVLPATNASEAVRLARNHWIDGALVSLDLDDNGGAFLLMRLLRAIDGLENLPIALVSDGVSPLERLAAARAAASLLLNKPLEPELLTNVGQEFASLRRAEPGRALLLTDESALVDDVLPHIERVGMGLFVCSSPDDVLDVLDAERPDILLVSSHVRAFTAPDVCRFVRGDPRWQDLPIVAIDGDGSLRHLCFGAGCDDYVTREQLDDELIIRMRARLEDSRRLHERADRDALTGLLTRRGLTESLKTRLAETIRHHRSLAVGLLDLDDLKEINDRHGHLAGDRVLHNLGRLLSSSFRAGDVRARLGGDEFVITMDGQDKDTAAAVLGRILEQFRHVCFADDFGCVFNASFTAGVASAPQDGTSHHTLLSTADRRLYAAKRKGKNCVVA